MTEIKRTPLGVCADLGITTAEVDIKSNDGVCFVYEGCPFAFTRTGLSEEKRQAALAYLIARLMLGHMGPWGNGSVQDRRHVPDEEQKREARAFLSEMFKGEQSV